MANRLIKYFFIGLLLFPFAFLLLLSLGRGWAYPDVLPQHWTVENWRFIWGIQAGLGRSALLSLSISLGIAGPVTLASFVVSKFIAYDRHRRRWLVLAYLPYVFAPVILAACLQGFFLRAEL